MARGRKKKVGPDVKQKVRGYYLVRIIDENKNDVYLPGINWDDVVELYNAPKVKITMIESINTPGYRPEDITKETLKKLAGGKNG